VGRLVKIEVVNPRIKTSRVGMRARSRKCLISDHTQVRMLLRGGALILRELCKTVICVR